jgi:hypothetical protein
LAAGLISVLQCKRPFGKKESPNGIPKGGTHLQRISLRLTSPQAELLRWIVDQYLEEGR